MLELPRQYLIAHIGGSFITQKISLITLRPSAIASQVFSIDGYIPFPVFFLLNLSSY